MDKKIKYTVEYNKTNKTWVLWKNIESYHSYNFYPIYECNNRNECRLKLMEVKHGKISKTKV